jgi:hypothetical protein
MDPPTDNPQVVRGPEDSARTLLMILMLHSSSDGNTMPLLIDDPSAIDDVSVADDVSVMPSVTLSAQIAALRLSDADPHPARMPRTPTTPPWPAANVLSELISPTTFMFYLNELYVILRQSNTGLYAIT